MSRKPLILVTNDDGISAPGIRALISVMNEIGNVVVIAPDSPQSAMGHAITINSTLHCHKIKIDDGPQIEYSCSGTPADCVKLGINEILDSKPDICVSGVNHGSNSSINVIYSGTMSAAIEATIEGVPAIGFSLLDYRWKANFNHIKNYIKEITLKALDKGIPKGIALNVNFPNLIESEIKGIKICRQAKAYWIEKFDKRTNPQGREYYWLTGEFVNEDKSKDTDEHALNSGYISIVPVKHDLTDHDSMKRIKDWDL
ncbi:MAG: 5'/3'-nucleotidase SurE [Flavobacteriaceae bacterium]|nr:5'/3'-nucleotidase SurE [Flavobacteriaceae bacterium]|tara:strand:+ start:5887 stop:6657 length:771 start_codon:yes stop_codon:yes gene_type:complete